MVHADGHPLPGRPAGISLISVAAAAATDIAGFSAAGAATLVGVLGLLNGGAFATMPSTAGKFFGVSQAGAIYGLMLMGWSIGGVVGPLAISALVGTDQNYAAGFTAVGIIALAAIVLTFISRRTATRASADIAPMIDPHPGEVDLTLHTGLAVDHRHRVPATAIAGALRAVAVQRALRHQHPFTGQQIGDLDHAQTLPTHFSMRSCLCCNASHAAPWPFGRSGRTAATTCPISSSHSCSTPPSRSRPAATAAAT